MKIVDKHTFNSLVKNPDSIDLDVIPNLEATTKAFPYCQITYSLLAKASTIQNTDLLQAAKPKAAAYALNRIALQDLLENNEAHSILSISEDNAEMAAPSGSTDPLLASKASMDISTDMTEKQKHQQKIIEGFIKKNPRIPTLKINAEHEIPSLDLTGRVAQQTEAAIETEAFALILQRQGKINQAIDIYQKLILKKPEKKNYFAKKLSELNSR
jgi:hypothetical protein